MTIIMSVLAAICGSMLGYQVAKWRYQHYETFTHQIVYLLFGVHPTEIPSQNIENWMVRCISNWQACIENRNVAKSSLELSLLINTICLLVARTLGFPHMEDIEERKQILVNKKRSLETSEITIDRIVNNQ